MWQADVALVAEQLPLGGCTARLTCGLPAMQVVSIIGDGAITGGMAYEAMNHAGFLDTNMIVILNDNQQVCMGARAYLCFSWHSSLASQ